MAIEVTEVIEAATIVIKSAFWAAVAGIHFVGCTWDSVKKCVDSVKSNTAVCVEYFKNPKSNVKGKSDGDKVDSGVHPLGSTDKTSVSGRGTAKEIGRWEVSKAACTVINDLVDMSGKLLLDAYLFNIVLVQNPDGTMWYWPWCVFHDKCHMKPKEDNLKALAEALKQLEDAGVIKNGKFDQTGFNTKWPKKIEISKV